MKKLCWNRLKMILNALLNNVQTKNNTNSNWLESQNLKSKFKACKKPSKRHSLRQWRKETRMNVNSLFRRNLKLRRLKMNLKRSSMLARRSLRVSLGLLNFRGLRRWRGCRMLGKRLRMSMRRSSKNKKNC